MELDIKGEVPKLLHELVETHLDDLGYNETELQELLALNKDEFKAQYLQDPSRPFLRIIHQT